MNLLLDTHALIWFLEDNPRLSIKAKSFIEDIENDVFVSIASWFEISIKLTLGKLELPDSLAETVVKSSLNQISTLGILAEHLIAYQKLPLHQEHRDPFDRIIIATAIVQNYAIVSSDPKFDFYKDLVQVIS